MKSTSTWISKGVAASALLVLAGCIDGSFPGLVDRASSAPESVVVSDDSIVISGPPGYCVDERATRNVDGGTFVLLGSCASLTADPGRPAPEQPLVLTVTVSRSASVPDNFAEAAPAWAAYMQSDAGRAVLSRSGDPDEVEILEAEVVDGRVFLHARDTGSALARGVGSDTWRGLFGLRNRLITVSAVGPSDDPIPAQDGLAMLQTLAQRISVETERRSAQ